MRMLFFNTNPHPTGNLTAIEGRAVPFVVRRVFYIHDVPGGAKRGGHAHHKLEEVIIAVSGSFDVVTLSGHGPQRWRLNRADRGLYLPPNVWRHLTNFSSNAIALVLASTLYDPDDYIRDPEEFLDGLPPVKGDFYRIPDDVAEAVRTHG